MTREEAADLLNPVVRHGMTVVAGLLAAHGFSEAGNGLVSYAEAATAALVALAWSWIEKGKMRGMVDALPASDITQLAETVHQMTVSGASPLLVAHLAQSLAVITANVITANEVQAATTPPPPPPAPEPDRSAPMPEAQPSPFAPPVFVSDPVVQPVPDAGEHDPGAGA